MKFQTSAVLLLATLLYGHSAAAQSTAELAAGEVFVVAKEVKGSDVPKMVVTAVVDSPVEKVYEVISNCDKFEDRMPRILEAKFVHYTPSAARCDVTVDIPFPLSNLRALTQDKRQAGPLEWYRKWWLVEGDYKTLVGSFVLKRFQNSASRTLLVYTVHADPKSVVPDFLREKAQRKSLPDMIERIREEAKKL